MIVTKANLALCLLTFALSPLAALAASDIQINLKMDCTDYVSGERIRGVVDVANGSADRISVGGPDATDRLFIEVYRVSDQQRLTRLSKGVFVAAFTLESGEGQKLATCLGDHYALREPSRYYAKPVLVHGRSRYEGEIRVFDVVDGVGVSHATQVFANREGLQREFSLVRWTRKHVEHLFLKAQDAGVSKRAWETRDLGPILRIDKPTISILPTGEVITLHRLNADQFLRSEFWSLTKTVEFRGQETVRDPETAGTARVRELYKDSGVKPKENPWWKFW